MKKSHLNLSKLSTLALAIFSAFSYGENVENEEIESIIVYAQKRAQDINDVSVAVTRVDGETIEQLHIKDTTQLASLVPNFKSTTVSGEGTTPSLNIRGIGIFDYNTSTISPIAIYSDGVVAGGANFLASNLFDLEHVEVLRGPQGTLFGRNTTGGAVLLMSKQPENEFSGYVSASIAEQNHSTLTGAVNVPISDNTSARVAVNRQDYNYSMNNMMPAPAGQQGGMEQNNFRVTFKTTLENATILTKLHAEDSSGSPKPIYNAGIYSDPATGAKCPIADVGTKSCYTTFGGNVDSDDYWQTMADTGDKSSKTESWGASVNASIDLDDKTTLKSITAYKTLDRFHSWDADGPFEIIEGSFGSDNNVFSQEISLAKDWDNIYWLSGLFYLNEELTQSNDIDIFRMFRAVPELASIPAQFFYNNKLKNQSVAIYSQADFTLNDKYTLTAGLRYTDETTKYNVSADLDIVGAYIPDVWQINDKVEGGEFSGKLALVQKVNEHSSIYYSYSRGYKSGGYNAGYSTSYEQARDSAYAPETVNSYEVTGRFDFWQSDANLNLTAFYYDYTDQQVFVNLLSATAPYHVLRNAGDSSLYGMEAEFKVTPTNDLSFLLNIGYIPEADIGKYEEGDISVEETRLPFTSEWNVSAMMQYDTEINNKTLFIQLGFDYQSRFYFDQNENPYTMQAGYILWNARMSYELTEQVELSLWGKNLFNQEYADLRFDSIALMGAITELRGEARQLGVEVKYSF